MVGLLDALRRFDRDLARSLDVDMEPQLFLEDVEAGSIKSWIATVLRSTDDDAIKSGDWKKVLGDYLVKAKYIVLSKLEEASTITQPRLLEDIQVQLADEIGRGPLGMLVGYTPLTRSQLAAHIADITTALEPLRAGDGATFEGLEDAPVAFNPRLRVNEEELNELLATRTLSNDNELILKVKKPDFLGSSMWEFHYDGHAVQASILDREWLDLFRRDGLGVRPGVALRAMVRVQVAYDEENDALPAKFTILRVYEVIQPTAASVQIPLVESFDGEIDELENPDDDEHEHPQLLLPAPPPGDDNGG